MWMQRFGRKSHIINNFVFVHRAVDHYVCVSYRTGYNLVDSFSQLVHSKRLHHMFNRFSANL